MVVIGKEDENGVVVIGKEDEDDDEVLEVDVKLDVGCSLANLHSASGKSGNSS